LAASNKNNDILDVLIVYYDIDVVMNKLHAMDYPHKIYNIAKRYKKIHGTYPKYGLKDHIHDMFDVSKDKPLLLEKRISNGDNGCSTHLITCCKVNFNERHVHMACQKNMLNILHIMLKKNPNTITRETLILGIEKNNMNMRKIVIDAWTKKCMAEPASIDQQPLHKP